MTSQKNNTFQIPYISDKSLKKRATNFLKAYSLEDEVPVPVEHLAENLLGISIIPTKNLVRYWGIDGFLTSDMSKIIIDDDTFMKYEERCRFTIAHEVAHLALHKKAYKQLNVTDKKSYIRFQENGNLEMKRRMEIQAYRFAGYLLLPETTFNPTLQSLLEEIDYENTLDIELLSQIIRDIGTKFRVSSECLQKQIDLEFPEVKERIFSGF